MPTYYQIALSSIGFMMITAIFDVCNNTGSPLTVC